MITASEKLVSDRYVSHLDYEQIEAYEPEELKNIALQQISLNKKTSVKQKQNEIQLVHSVSWENIKHYLTQYNY